MAHMQMSAENGDGVLRCFPAARYRVELMFGGRAAASAAGCRSPSVFERRDA
jgi:hypothetical protein